MSVDEHKKHGADIKLVCGVITVSDTRGHINDISGKTIIDALTEAGHKPLYYKVVMDEQDAIRTELESALKLKELGAVIMNGGSGIGARDVTIEAAVPLFDKTLPGFGELFRMLSYDEIGSATMMSRAAAGIAGGKIVFVLPGSPKAVKLAMEKLIVPELGHMVHELTRHESAKPGITDDACDDKGEEGSDD
jgi:molybdenum cofactor biosynthesis protein B